MILIGFYRYREGDFGQLAGLFWELRGYIAWLNMNEKQQTAICGTVRIESWDRVRCTHTLGTPRGHAGRFKYAVRVPKLTFRRPPAIGASSLHHQPSQGAVGTPRVDFAG